MATFQLIRRSKSTVLSRLENLASTILLHSNQRRRSQTVRPFAVRTLRQSTAITRQPITRRLWATANYQPVTALSRWCKIHRRGCHRKCHRIVRHVTSWRHWSCATLEILCRYFPTTAVSLASPSKWRHCNLKFPEFVSVVARRLFVARIAWLLLCFSAASHETSVWHHAVRV